MKKLKKKVQKTNKYVYALIKNIYKQFKTFKDQMKKTWLIIAVVLGTTAMATSCNVTRTITNESQYYQRGDTSVVIQTKTIETYDAVKKGI